MKHGHLSLHPLELASGQEWRFRGEGWGFIRIDTGFGYWRERSSNREVSSGDVVVVPSCSEGYLLASRLSKLRGHCFRILPDMLSGILSLSECQRLRCEGQGGRAVVRVFDKQGEVAAAYSEICRSGSRQTLAGRVQLLRLFSAVFQEDLEQVESDVRPVHEARQRLLQLAERMPEAELSQISMSLLAERLRCSERHAGRVFRLCFGVSLRQKQTELRMNLARRLLLESEAKIVEIAMESGYQSLGLFNAMFKRRFGMTPSMWRQKGGGRKTRNEASKGGSSGPVRVTGEPSDAPPAPICDDPGEIASLFPLPSPAGAASPQPGVS